MYCKILEGYWKKHHIYFSALPSCLKDDGLAFALKKLWHI